VTYAGQNGTPDAPQFDHELAATLRVALEPDIALGPAIGQGGTAVVYEAHERNLRRRVAVKALRTNAASSSAADYFRREILIIASLEHAHVIPIYRAGLTTSIPYMVMPRVGSSLAHRLAGECRVHWPEATRIAFQVADALAYVHREGITHCDIKPENILLDDCDRVLLSDFGIAHRSTADEFATIVRLVRGTPGFMSPEQALGESAQPWFDTYALGVVLHIMLTGHFPFRGRNIAAVVAQQLSTDAPKVSQPDMPTQLRSLVSTALARRVRDRFANGASMRDALQSIRETAEAAAARSTIVALPALRRQVDWIESITSRLMRSRAA
jgi:eukaryotic-like serine/threonine-protein kinase